MHLPTDTEFGTRPPRAVPCSFGLSITTLDFGTCAACRKQLSRNPHVHGGSETSRINLPRPPYPVPVYSSLLSPFRLSSIEPSVWFHAAQKHSKLYTSYGIAGLYLGMFRDTHKKSPLSDWGASHHFHRVTSWRCRFPPFIHPISGCSLICIDLAFCHTHRL